VPQAIYQGIGGTTPEGLKVKTGTESKLKFKLLLRRIKGSRWMVRGLLDTIWEFTSTNAPDGDLSRFSAEELAIGIDWQDDPEQLISILVELKWMDRTPDGRLLIHDWHEHCEDSIHNLLARKGVPFASGHPPKLTRLELKERPNVLQAFKLLGFTATDDGKLTGIVSQERRQTPPNAFDLQQNAQPCLALPHQAPPSPSGAGTPAASPGVGGGDDFWKPAQEACEAIGFVGMGFPNLVKTCRSRGITPAEVVMACRFATKDRYDNPPGAVTEWAKAHDPTRAVEDARSWTTPKAPPPKPKPPPTPEQARQSVEYEAVRLAKAGNLDDAVRLLETLNAPRESWPLAVLSKLEKA
jgi:hypothetical protein